MLLRDNLDESTLFDEDLTSKPNKSVLVKELEGKLQSSDYNFNNQSDLSTAIMLDFMLQI